MAYFYFLAHQVGYPYLTYVYPVGRIKTSSRTSIDKVSKGAKIKSRQYYVKVTSSCYVAGTSGSIF